MEKKSRDTIVTGDRPTGPLHIGHYVGSLCERIKLQYSADCYFIIADLHTLTTKPTKLSIDKLPGHVFDLLAGYLACGIDPSLSNIYLQSSCPAVFELNLRLQMLVSVSRITGLPSLKEMAQCVQVDEDQMSLGLLGYPVLQAADILMNKATFVPVGKDNIPHVEITRDIARRFNNLYGEYFDLPESLVSLSPSLPGIDGKGKMSKSQGNAIFLFDDEETVLRKVMKMYTDPKRIRSDIPGTVEGNPVFIYHDIFTSNREQVEEMKKLYALGKIGDVEVKRTLSESLNRFLAPIREAYFRHRANESYLRSILKEGTQVAQNKAEMTLKDVKKLMGWSALERLLD